MRGVKGLRIGRQPALLVVAVAVAGATLLGATCIVVRDQVEAVYATQYEGLEAIARLRVSQVAAWQAERLGDARATAGSPFFAGAVARWVADAGNETLRGDIEGQLRLTLESYQYENALLLGLDGRLLAAARPDHAAAGPGTRGLIDHVAEAGASPAFEDVTYEDDRGHVHVDVAAAIRDGAGEAMAVLVLRSDPTATLYPRLLVWPTASLSGETLLVRREGDQVVFLSTPRLGGGAPPSGIDLARVDVPATQAVLGRTGRFEGRDYRGVEVLADLRPVPGSQWYLVNKLDLAEVAGDAWERGGLTVVLAVLAVIVAGGLAVLLFLVRQRLILRRLYEAERQRTAAVRHFDRLFALARDAFLLIDPSGRIVEANVAAAAMYGYSRDELVTLAATDLRAPEAMATLERDRAASASAEGALYQTVHRRRDGTLFPVEISSRFLEIDGQLCRQSTIRDITERSAAAAVLAEQVDELRRWNVLALGREARVLALKREVNELLGALGRSPRYDPDPADPSVPVRADDD